MRPSLKKHVLAVLREVIGFKQPMMAELLGCSLSSIQSIEVGRLPLSEKMAQRVALETGVAIEWLLKNNIKEPPVCPLKQFTRFRRPFTKEYFEHWRAEKERPKNGSSDLEMSHFCTAIEMARVAAILQAAWEQGRFELFRFKIWQAVTEIGEEVLGEDAYKDSFSNNPVLRSIENLKTSSEKPDLTPVMEAYAAAVRKALAKKKGATK
jgi:transcriptional regulator with XRE-family HTH domain